MDIRKGFYDLAVPIAADGLTETLEEIYECKLALINTKISQSS